MINEYFFLWLPLGVIFSILFLLYPHESGRSKGLSGPRDPMTHLHNRTYLVNYLEELALLEDEESTYSIMMIEVDAFLVIQASYGEDSAQTVLKELAFHLDFLTLSEDILSYYGGEKFTLLMKDLSREYVMERWESLQKSIATVRFGRDKITLQLSAGASSREGSRDLKTALEEADIALYVAKSLGEKSLRFFE